MVSTRKRSKSPARRRERSKSSAADNESGMRRVASSRDFQQYEDATIDFLYKPHTVTFLFIFVVTLSYAALALDDETALVRNVSFGLFGVASFVVAISLLVAPDGPFQRPHPAVWRAVFGISLLYTSFLISVLFLTATQARQLLALFDETLGVPLPEKNYAENCALTWENVSDVLLDRFVVAHLFGWMLKAVLLRDFKICLILSMLWEWLEITFVFLLPNFAECWWDQLIVDFLLCNGIGMLIGLRLNKYLEMRSHDWLGVRHYRGVKNKLKRAIRQFTPESWLSVQWHVFSSWRRFTAVTAIVVCLEIAELNAFFLKTVLWIPSEHNLNLVRLGLWWIIGLPAVREWYIYIVDPKCKRLGSQSWVAATMLVAETLIVLKFGGTQFESWYPPLWITVAWLAIIGAWLASLLVLFLRDDRARRSRKKKAN